MSWFQLDRAVITQEMGLQERLCESIFIVIIEVRRCTSCGWSIPGGIPGCVNGAKDQCSQVCLHSLLPDCGGTASSGSWLLWPGQVPVPLKTFLPSDAFIWECHHSRGKENSDGCLSNIVVRGEQAASHAWLA